MSTKRQAIESFREKLRERSSDSTYSNQFLYNVLLENAKWLIKREVSAGRIYANSFFFQDLSCVEVIETSPIDDCCPIKTNCKIYRTKDKIPDLWIDNRGPIIKSIRSIDGSSDFFYTNANTWASKRIDPYRKLSDQKYCFFSNGYIWFPENNPHLVRVSGFFTEDISSITNCNCNKKKTCNRYLDTKFLIPEWLEAEMYAKALEQLAGITKKLPEDQDMNKNATRKN